MMQSGKQETNLNTTQKTIVLFIIFALILSFTIFRNLFFQPSLLLKNFAETSIDPEIAFKNNKPTFLEFYAEWCEVCKEMAPKVSSLKDEYENNINFVFLNVDNPKWGNYIKKYNVNGIPQVNLFNDDGNLKATLIGKQEEIKIRESLENLKEGVENTKDILNSDALSLVKEKKKFQVAPRSHS